jgi:hypothetical protein
MSAISPSRLVGAMIIALHDMRHASRLAFYRSLAFGRNLRLISRVPDSRGAGNA